MPSWSDVSRAAPSLAAAVAERFEAHGLALMATLRRDGSPRISGIELLFAMDELWLGMMLRSRKADDLTRDPRFALHNATTDKQVTNGDARISGRAVAVEDEPTVEQFRQAFQAHTGQSVPAGPFHLFRADVGEISLIRPGGDHLKIDWWTAKQGLRSVERR